MPSIKPNINRIAIFSTGVALGLSIMSGAALADAAPSHDPSGNNGTIKVDGIDFDDTLGTEPHVGCSFQIDFYGFDLGDTADIRFIAQPPSGEGQELRAYSAVPISTTAAAGGPNDAEGMSVTYLASDLGLAALTPSNQGYHVKVEANVTDAPGGAKQKVFWIDCPPVIEDEVIVDEVIDEVIVEEVIEEEVILDEQIVDEVIVEEVIEEEVILDEQIVDKVIVEEVIVEETKTDVVVDAVVVANPVIPEVSRVVDVNPGSPAVLETPVTPASVLPAQAAVAQATQAAIVSTPGPRPVETKVLGTLFSRDTSLPRTGVDTGPLTLVGGLLLAIGTALARMGPASPARSTNK